MIKDRLTIIVIFMTRIPDPLLLFVDVDDVLVGRVRLRERVKLVHLLDVPIKQDDEEDKEDVHDLDDDDEDDETHLQRAVNSAGIS